MMVSFSICRSGSGPFAVLSFGAVNRNRQRRAVQGPRTLREQSGLAIQRGFCPAQVAGTLCDQEGGGRLRRDSGLEPNGRRFRPPRNRRADRTRGSYEPERIRKPGKPRTRPPPNPPGLVTSTGAPIRVSDHLHPRGRPVSRSLTVNSWHAKTRLPLPVVPACARAPRSPAGALW